MATADEILATMAEADETSQVFVIDNDLRIISPPAGVAVLGVESDDDVHRLYFEMPCHFCNVDLSKFHCYIHYRNANKEPDMYVVTDTAVDGDCIKFSWLVGRHAAKYKGDVQFIVCLKEIESGNVTREFNTTLASLPVLEGLPAQPTSEEEETVRDVIQQLLAIIDDKTAIAIDSVAAEGATQIEAVRKAGTEVNTSIPPDYTETVKEVNRLGRETAPAIECEATGSVVTVTDAAEQPVVELISHIEPVQAGSGDPSPDNVRPISGWDKVNTYRTGANLAGEVVKAALASVGGDMEEIVCNESYRSIFLPVVQNTTYTIRRMAIDTDMRFRTAFTSEKATVGKNASLVGRSVHADNETVLTVTAPAGARFLYVYVNNAGKDIDLSQYSIVVGDVAGEFDPYNGQFLTADLPETVYGGTLDWTTGVLTLSKKRYHIDGTSVPTLVSSETSNNRVAYTLDAMSTDYNTQDAICNNCAYKTSVYYDTATDVGFCKNRRNLYFRLSPDVDGTNMQAIQTYFAANPTDVVYTLAEPYTIQLTPQQLDTLRGTNNLWSDCGDTSVVYVADTKMYIDNKLAAISAAMLNL